MGNLLGGGDGLGAIEADSGGARFLGSEIESGDLLLSFDDGAWFGSEGADDALEGGVGGGRVYKGGGVRVDALYFEIVVFKL